MGIRTFSVQEKYRGGEETEPRKKLKKVRSVKVANLDRLRLSMRKDRFRFARVFDASSDDVTEASQSSSAAISGTSSPNYMKATTSSSARKFSKVIVQDYSDPAGVNIPVNVKPEKSLKRMTSLRQSKKLSSKRSMKIRAKYSQFSDVSVGEGEMLGFGRMGFLDNTEINAGLEFDPQSLNVRASHDQESMVETGAKQKGILGRSRSRKMMRLKSMKSSRTRQRLKSRFNGEAAEIMSQEAGVSSAEPHFMKGTSTHEAKKNSDKGLARTSSLRPLRILAKIPSLRPKRNKVKKRPQGNQISGTGVTRATCSSTLKRTEIPDDVALHLRAQESEGVSSFHVCPYSYCSIHGHRHQTPSQPLKEFISARRKLLGNKKGERKCLARDKAEHCLTETKNDQPRETFSTESNGAHKLMHATTEDDRQVEDDGMDYIIKIYAKPRKKWDTTEDALNENSAASYAITYDQISVGDSDGKQEETLSEALGIEEKQGALYDDQHKRYEILRVLDVYSSDKAQQQNNSVAALSLPLEIEDSYQNSVSIGKAIEPSIEEEHQKHSDSTFHSENRLSEVITGGYLTNILSDKQKYTSMWHLIYQELVSNEESMNEAQEVIQGPEKEGGDGVDDGVAATESIALDETAAIKLVQGAIDAILHHEVESHQQSNPAHEMEACIRSELSFSPTSPSEEILEGSEVDVAATRSEWGKKQHKMKQIGDSLLPQEEPNEREASGTQMSKSLSKLRKILMTAKFIKAMEKLKKINAHTLQHLAAETKIENERVYLRHLSMNEMRNSEEWMLDYALRQVISRLDPKQQKRVAQLVEAFERVAPGKNKNGSSSNPLTSMPAPSRKLAIPMDGELKKFATPKEGPQIQVVQEQDDGFLASHKGATQENSYREEHDYQAKSTGNNILQESDEMYLSNSTSLSLVMNSESTCANSSFGEGGKGNNEPVNTLKVPSYAPTKDSEFRMSGDHMTNIFSNKQKYTSMWNLIYQHVSSEASINEKQVSHEFNEEKGGDTYYSELNDRDSTPKSYDVEQKEDQSATGERPELDQSAAIKLVKEAIGALLESCEQPNLNCIQDYYKASGYARVLCNSTPTSCTEDNAIERGKSAEKRIYSDVKEKTHLVDDTNLPLQQQVESGELKAPQRKMSKSLSKLKKAIATARFIKAMEKLTKRSPRKSYNHCSDTASMEERIYLRHQSMDGRKKDEQWMLDYALRKVISKLDPDQQRKVALLVEAFETVHPEHRENINSHCLKGEAANSTVFTFPTNKPENAQQKCSIPIEPNPQKQDDCILLSTRDESPEKSLQEHHDQQPNSADDIILQVTNETTESHSTSELSEGNIRLTSEDFTLEEPKIEKQETRAMESNSSKSTHISEAYTGGDMATILLDKQKYTSMWNLIYQHVLSNEASTTGKQEVNEDDEEGKPDDANTSQAEKDPDSFQSTQLKESEIYENNRSAVFDQSAAIQLVKEAINAILQKHEQTSDQQSLRDHHIGVDTPTEICGTTALFSTIEKPELKIEENHGHSEPKDKLHKIENKSGLLQQQAEPNEEKIAPRKLSKSLSKLKKAIVTAKFIKAMERLQKINPRKPRHLSPEVASERERVYLRHLSIKDRKSDEEWMLDYALKKVISNLAPEQQRKVALLVEAFETVKPEKKSIRYQKKSECDPAIESNDKVNVVLSYGNNNPPMEIDRQDMLGKGITFGKREQEDHGIKSLNLRRDLSSKILNSDDTNLHPNQAISRGSPVTDQLQVFAMRKEEDNVSCIDESFQKAKGVERDTEANITKGIFCDKQKNNSMWYMIYQHVQSISETEDGSTPTEIQISQNQMKTGGASSEMIADADVDDSDTSSEASELTESDAIKLVRDAINDILETPQDLENKVSSSNRAAAIESQRAVEEKPKKGLSRGYSKLRKLIICNKFIKTMEQTQKFYPQKKTGQALHSESEAEKANLKTRAVGERKGIDEWMLDNMLQNVIAGLAPVQQRKVALLVQAFEKVNPEEKTKRLCYTKTEFPDTSSEEGGIKEKEDIISSQNSKFSDSLDLNLETSKTSGTEKVAQEILKDITGRTNEFVLNGEKRSDSPGSATAETSEEICNFSDTCKATTETDEANAPCVLLEERTSFKKLKERISEHEQLAGNTKLAFKFPKMLPQLENLEDGWNYSSQEKSASLWGLILQRVTTDMLEKPETPEKCEIEADAHGDSSETSENKNDGSSQLALKVKNCRDMGVQTPKSFDFQENEAVKLVEEAVEEMLLLQDQICDTESITISTTSDQKVNSDSNGDPIEPSTSATQIAEVPTSLHSVIATPPDEKMTSSKETSPSSYNTFYKFILCKRYVKAMDKMRKLKAVPAQDISQHPHSEESTPSLRQVSTSDKNSWEEGMLDHALQKVIGNLAPAKKQRVALLVQAFETVGSQPEPKKFGEVKHHSHK
ncbi:calmodulin binding protein PICBP-like isoform X2 [Amaranthus tricolor]|uniref:calmodulin binding protein PICBP-like isoform X2 n=1 Tax=Amaranthus tricolor TaxID=29722 RepID=UPI00258CD411|nr:calmodulin binding protein PICBP-like isoform X2 [Amaranthus tricolor]